MSVREGGNLLRMQQDEIRALRRKALMVTLAVGDDQSMPGFDTGHTLEVMYGKQADALIERGYATRADTLVDAWVVLVRTNQALYLKNAAFHAACTLLRRLAEQCADEPAKDLLRHLR